MIQLAQAVVNQECNMQPVQVKMENRQAEE